MKQVQPKTLLLADNSAEYRRSLRTFLELEGFQVVEAETTQAAKEKLDSQPIDLALIDLKLASEDEYDITGLEVARAAAQRSVPAIIITLYPSVEAARQAMRSRGIEPQLALDFVPKANGPTAILDAINVLSASRKWEPSRAGSRVVVEPERKLVWHNGMEVDLSENQYALVDLLYKHHGAVCNWQEIIREVYGEQMILEKASTDRRLERLVARVRKKLEDDPNHPKYILSVPGRGLRWGGEE